jgi:hypothetical protein
MWYSIILGGDMSKEGFYGATPAAIISKDLNFFDIFSRLATNG